MSNPTIAMKKKVEVEGYETFVSLFLQFTVAPDNSVYRVVSLKRVPNTCQLKLSD